MSMELVPIHGSPPDLRDPPPGCRFAPRCPFVQPPARPATSRPPSPGAHLSACRRDGEADLSVPPH
jgi:ABC-type dipeptide/oligopeptide/nickel transport system ATPase component